MVFPAVIVMVSVTGEVPASFNVTGPNVNWLGSKLPEVE